MKKYYIICNRFQNCVVQLSSNKTFSDLEPYLDCCSSKKLPEDVTFNIVKGEKWTDLIYYYEAACRCFYSQRFVDILSERIDLKNICYPIKIAADDAPTYYVLYNKKEYDWVNEDYLLDDLGEPPYFFLPTDAPEPPSLFTYTDYLRNVIDEETMSKMKKMKLTNIYFKETYALNDEERKAWKILHSQNKPFLPM